MSAIFELLWPFAFVPTVILYLLSRHTNSPQKLRGAALHPYNILGFFLVIIGLNFLGVEQQVTDDIPVYFARYTITDQADVIDGLILFILFSAALMSGIGAAQLASDRSPLVATSLSPPNPKSANLLFVVACIVTGITTVSVIYTSLGQGSFFSVAGNRTNFFRDNPALQVFAAVLVPAFIVFASTNTERPIRLLAGLALACALTLPLGGRGAIFLLFIIFFVVISLTRYRIPAFGIYLVSPLVFIFLQFLRYLREFSGSGSFDRFLDIRGQAASFSGDDFTSAQAIITANANHILDRYPFESLVGMIVAGIPRSLLWWKPDGASAAFTQAADPLRWTMTKSEWLVTGFGNLLIEMGSIGGILCAFILGYFWANYFARSHLTTTAQQIKIVSISIITCYIFMRADLYNLSLFLWPLAVVLVCKMILDWATTRTPSLVRGTLPDAKSRYSSQLTTKATG